MVSELEFESINSFKQGYLQSMGLT